MAPDPLPFPTSESRAGLNPRYWRSFFRSNGTLKIRFFPTVFLLSGIIVYLMVFPPQISSRRFPVWYLTLIIDTYSVELPRHYESIVDLNLTLDTSPHNPPPKSNIPDDSPLPPPSSSPVSDILTVEQIRDIVAPTRGFFSRDYNLGLGWNSMRDIFEAALLQAELLNRTLVLPSFVYARACEYDNTVCADYVTMLNMGDATGSNEWRELPIEQQMGFRIPISVMVNMTHLRNRRPVITVSEYLRLNGQNPEIESSSGSWLRQLYHTRPNIFEANETKTPSLFVIENHWHGAEDLTLIDYIPVAMKQRGNLDRHPRPDNYGGSTKCWPSLEPTELSRDLCETMLSRSSSLDWDTAKNVLVKSPDLVGDVNLDDDEAIEGLLNAHGWEVLHTFPSVLGMEFAKIVAGYLKVVVPRLSIRGFKDDYHDVDAEVIVLAGESHRRTKPGAMLFTEELARQKFASKVVHSLIPPQNVFDLAEVLSSRMRLWTEGRMWMGAHMRRGDFVGYEMAMEMDPKAHIRRVKEHLQAGRTVLVDLYDRNNWTTWDIEGTQPDLEQTTLPPPEAEDPFFVATDERNPDTLRKFAAAGAVFMSDLVTREDRQAFGWPLMFTDVMALVEQEVLVRAGYFYGHRKSSPTGAIINMRACHGADPRTTLLD